MLLIIAGSKRIKYECFLCDYTSDNNSDLMEHTQTHDTVKDDDLKCEHCEYTTD